MTEKEVLTLLRQRTEEISISQTARDLGVRHSLLSMILSGDRGLSKSMLKKLGLNKNVSYTRTGRAFI